MVEGLLWYDDNPVRTLDEKVALAARRHRRKFGRAANACYVHPSALGDVGETVIEGVTVRPLASVLPSHFWIGREEGDGEA